MSTPPKKKSNSGGTGLSYRERTVDETLDDHDARITTNERWRYIIKGALVTLAVSEGSSKVVDLVTALF